MLGNMQGKPLLISSILEFAEQYHSDQEIVSRTTEGGISRCTFAQFGRRTRRASNMLKKLGIKEGDNVGTLAWNTARHLEVYFGISGMGAILHTLNPRLFAEQLIYIINHADDVCILVDLSFVPLLEEIAERLDTVRHFIVLTDRKQMPASRLSLLCYEELMDDASEEFEWPQMDENHAAALCYTSGTTGNPKGVLYSHRCTLLHAWAFSAPSALSLSDSNTLLPAVPMFHVNAWGVPYAALMNGSKLVLPGPNLDGASLFELIEAEQADTLMGVPTVWLGVLDHVRKVGKRLDSVKKVLVGGSAAPISMIRELDQEHDVFLLHLWGMTEMTPIGTMNVPNRMLDALSPEARYQLQTKQGRPLFGVDLRIVDDEGTVQPHDGKTFGSLHVRGPWVLERYYKSEETALTEGGWFDTGDVATVDEHGYMQIVDRAKDVIKSGGEWISSINLENIAVGHVGVAEACVIGVPHQKWDERPLLLLVRNPPGVEKEEILQFLEDKVAKWWLPDDILFVDELPHTATGKLKKNELRKQYQNHLS